MPSSLNGTGVTFNDGTTLQSGNIPAANLGSGTANSTTFLRGDRTFATPPSQAPTTAQVLSATAGAALGAVGTYALLMSTTSGRIVTGSTRAGSGLRFVAIRGDTTAADALQDNLRKMGDGGTPGGTWRAMCGTSSSFGFQGGVFLRIS